MKHIFTTFAFAGIVLFHSFGAKAQAPNWAWAKSAGGNSSDYGSSVATDAGKNILVTGYFRSPTITFGSTTLTNADNTVNTYDIFIVKYDEYGNILWAQSAGGNSSDAGRSVATDASGNILVTGYFYSPTIIFGTTTLTNANAGYSDIFIVKYDGNGNILWAQSAGGTSADEGYSVSTDAGGNVLVTGYFYSTTITFGTTTLINADNTGNTGDFFIVKYDNSGTVLWAKSAGGTSWDYGYSVSTDAAGNVFVTGYFGSPSITFGSITLTNAGSGDIFIVKYDASGTVLWAQSAGGTSSAVGRSVATAPGGNILVTGDFGSPSITFGSTTLTNAGGSDMFIVKYDGNGNILWAQSAGGTSGDYGWSVSTDAGGNVFVTGYFGSPAITFGSDTLTNAGTQDDMFLVKYAPSGTVLWAKSAGGSANDWGNSVATDASRNILVTGSFEGPSITFGSATLTNAGSFDMFLAKLYDCNTPPPATCLVTVDSLSQNNLIIWDKAPYAGAAADSFIIYREVQTSIYKRLDAVPFSALSIFADTFRTKYFVSPYWSLGDPNAGTYRYKIQVRDTCGNYSTLSPFHNTIFMSNSSGTFSWAQLYTIEGSPNPVMSYLLMRDNLNNGNWQVVNSVAGTQQQVVDPQYATYQATANWRIETQWSIVCNPTRINPTELGVMGITKSQSNTYKTVSGVNELTFENLVSIHPNPNDGTFTVFTGNIKVSRMEIYDMLGREVATSFTSGNGKHTFSLSGAKGVYILKIVSDSGMITRKVIIE